MTHRRDGSWVLAATLLLATVLAAGGGGRRSWAEHPRRAAGRRR